jgi:flagellar protein FliL
MTAKLLPLIFLVAGIGGGIGAGIFLVPGLDSTSEIVESAAKEPSDVDEEENTSATEFVKMSNQFVIPVVKGDKITAMVVVSLILETRNGISEEIYALEPKLRDAFLRVMFDHANMGGFQGAFTGEEVLGLLRTALREVARREIGPNLVDVLIVDIVRQDT